MAPNETVAFSPRETFAAAIFRETTDTTEDAHQHILTTLEESLIDTPRVEVIVTQAGNATETTIRETPTAAYEPPTIIHRKTSATVPRKTPTTPTSGAHPAFPPDEIPATPSVEATTTHKEILPAPPKENAPIAPTPKKTPMDTPRGITSASQGKASTIKPVIPLSYWSIMLIGITVTLVLAVGLCMVIYCVMFFIVVIYSTS
ncbi:uncharacterized protein LOC134395979 [Elgaria multicarinata webbii]|uniref:uncharacterized protein LOC134395979 n=1 Tax=Elgaria multicarinata webbii TaxID=159646 RepID=UPI002FCD0F08